MQTATFDAKKFKTSTVPFFVESLFDGPLIVGKKLPTVKKKMSVLNDGAYLVGYPSKSGCFSILSIGTLSDGVERVNVAFYPEASPEELNAEHLWNAIHETFDVVPGFGFSIMAKMKCLMNHN